MSNRVPNDRVPRLRAGVAALLLVLTAGTLGARADEPAQAPDPDLDAGPLMERLIERCASDEQALRSFYGLPLSAFRLERLDRFARAWLDRLERVEFDALDTDGRVDYVLLRSHLEGRLEDGARQRLRNAETLALLPFAPRLIALEEARRRLEPLDAAGAAALLDAVREDLKAVRARLERGLGKEPPEDALRPSAVIAYRASKSAAALADTLTAWFTYRDGFEPAFGWWVRKPHASLQAALKGYATFLRERVAGVKNEKKAPLIGDPIGRPALLEALAREFIAYSPEQLLAIAQREFAFCETEGKKAAEELGIAAGWSAAVEQVKELHAAPGTQDDLVAQTAREAIRFVEEHELVTIPDLCRETWRLDMISARRQETLPFAVYSGQRMLVAYATEEMEHEAKRMSMRGNNEHFTRIVAPHELIPGHHLQLFMADRHRRHRRLFRTPFFVEGWALHWEMLLWDRGYARDARDRVGMLFWRMHRCARIIVTLRFHLGELEPAGMVDFLTDRVGLERDGATAEVRRYIAGAYGPLYQCAYMLGGLQLRALHSDLVGGGGMSDRGFHDAVLRQGAIPIELVRAALTGQVLGRDHATVWRFAGPIDGKAR